MIRFERFDAQPKLSDTEKMNTITLDIEDSRGHIVTIAADTDQILKQVVNDARDALGLPLQNLSGQGLRYVLFHTEAGRFLNPDITVYGHKLAAEDRLRIVPRSATKLFELELQSAPNPGMLYPLSPREMTIGRDFNNDIVVRHKTVSREHGLFEWTDGFHLYLDMDSANGSWINNVPITRLTPIADGDLLMLGQNIRLLYRERQKTKALTANLDHPITETRRDESRTALVSMPKAQVYVSYSPGQQALAQVIVEGLEKLGIRAGHDARNIESALQGSQILVAILSREAVASTELQEEWDYYSRMQRPIVPVLFEPCRVPPYMAKAPYIIEYTYNDNALGGDVIEAIQRLLQ
jgi:pSer/pThr/pTyr-binding forkhead associated (FHA) protein